MRVPLLFIFVSERIFQLLLTSQGRDHTATISDQDSQLPLHPKRVYRRSVDIESKYKRHIWVLAVFAGIVSTSFANLPMLFLSMSAVDAPSDSQLLKSDQLPRKLLNPVTFVPFANLTP